ncbi:exo-beta-N-acetylmuramidase NamZ domain-containing protein [uncultured Hymenobacter sp.]|uniref:exo-beta-N-acetylmuramidase NamZ family protein n=1 Tax=uncultured Hymenobacter sp. TaxID=170016 RepID=UPI0035CA0DF3
MSKFAGALALLLISVFQQPAASRLVAARPVVAFAKQPIRTGAEQTAQYVPYLKGKRVGILGNQTSIIGKRHLVDSLKVLQINIVKVFGPEHGFRGNASNGAHVQDEVDQATGIPIVSLYGAKRKPSQTDMAALDVMVFDLQDVGCRFYTNINTLGDIMEACAEAGKELVILDRPNPNGFVDGPVLDMKLKSGIGEFPVPITHGMTIGEFAQMINGQGWLPNNLKCKLKIISLQNYAHTLGYTLPVNPSPNLNTQQSILLYPSLCLFEGTILSQGRGTYMPFTVLGSPELKGKYSFSFTPVSLPGKSETPLHQDQVCYGLDLRKYDIAAFRKAGKININWLLELYKAYPAKEKFFDRSQSRQIGNIDGLAGTTLLKEQIIAGKSEQEIRKTWEPQLSAYKAMRKKYTLYP